MPRIHTFWSAIALPSVRAQGELARWSTWSPSAPREGLA
jgi:hypothetical protein